MSTINIMRVSDTQVIADTMNPREDFGDLEKLADSFAVNPTFPNEPFNPPVLVRDGESYKIVDGERRIRAMRLLGLDAYNAIVCDDMDAANTMLAMVATDDKKQLTDLERSRGVQQALLLGVAPEKVEKSLHVSGAARVKRGMDIAGDKALTLTIDHMLALDEFANDPERVDKILETETDSLKNLTNRYRSADKSRVALAALRSACDEAQITWCDTDAEFKTQKNALEKGHVFNKVKTFHSWQNNDMAEELKETVAEIAKGTNCCVAYSDSAYGSSWEATLYAEGEKVVNQKDARRKEFLKALNTLRKSWAGYLASGDLTDPRFALPIKREALRELVCNRLYSADNKWTNDWEPFAKCWFDAKQPSEIEISEQDACCTGLLAAALLDTWLNRCVFTSAMRESFAHIYSTEADCGEAYVLYNNANIAYREDNKTELAVNYWLSAVEDFRATIAKVADLGYEPQDIDFAVEEMLDSIVDILDNLSETANVEAAAAVVETETESASASVLLELPEDVADESTAMLSVAA